MSELKYIKLNKVAKDLGITPMTLWNWKIAGKIQFTKIGGLNFIDINTYNDLLNIKPLPSNEKTIIYCRVSSSVNKTNLQTQKERLINYCNAKGYKVNEIIEEYGSGLNDKRPKLEKLLKECNFNKLVIEHKDRLCIHGFNYIETLLNKQNIQIEVVNEPLTDKEDLLQDFISVITSYCARIYGSGRSKRKIESIINELNKED